MVATRDQAARELAYAHYQNEPGITRIVRVEVADGAEDESNRPIILLEVNEDTVPSGIQPLHFGPDPEQGINYPLIIVDVTPEEYHEIERGNLKLPDGWRITSECYDPPRNVQGVGT